MGTKLDFSVIFIRESPRSAFLVLAIISWSWIPLKVYQAFFKGIVFIFKCL